MVPWAGEHPQAHAVGRQVLHGVDQVGEVPAEAGPGAPASAPVSILR